MVTTNSLLKYCVVFANQYKVLKELTFFGELYDLSRAFYNSYGPMTFEDARQDIKEQRQKN